MSKKLYSADRWTYAPVAKSLNIENAPKLTDEDKKQAAKWREKILRKIEEEHKRD